jgi:hypothetical protein
MVLTSVATPVVSPPGKLVFLIASPVADRRVAWSGSRGRRTELCHWAVLICDLGITRETLPDLILGSLTGTSHVLQLGLLFELRRTGSTEYEVSNMPSFTADDLAKEFPICSVIFAGTTQQEEDDIITSGMNRN